MSGNFIQAGGGTFSCRRPLLYAFYKELSVYIGSYPISARSPSMRMSLFQKAESPASSAA